MPSKPWPAKLARLVYRMLRYGMQYVDKGAATYLERHRQLQIKQLKWKAATLGYQLIGAPAAKNNEFLGSRWKSPVAKAGPPDLRNEAVTMSPDLKAGQAALKAAIETSMPPLEVADVVFEAIKKEQFYILTHPERIEVIQLRTDKLLRMENPQSPAATIAKIIKLGVARA